MYNNYFNPQRFAPMPTQNYMPPMTHQATPVGLLGKVVESIDVVKATDIMLDGSVSYFPLTDGSAIVTKQLQTDGTSKMMIYKPMVEDKKDAVRFATFEELQDMMDEVKELKKQLKELKTKKGKDE